METEHKQGRKIPFFFVPIPRFAFDPNFFKDVDFFRFVCYAFYRTAFETKFVIHCNQSIDLDMFEFVFGRNYWAEELGLKERKVRTFMCQLAVQKLATKVASKSSNKYTVYKWVWEHFPGNFCQQSCRPEAGQAPACQPQIKNKKKEEEKQRQQEAAFAAAAFSIDGIAKQLFASLPEVEQKAVVDLFHRRAEKQAVDNVEAWFVKCIREGWHLEEKLQVPLQAIPKVSDFERNKALAEEVVNIFGGSNPVPISLRMDFLEIAMNGKKWQIFYSEPTATFADKMEFVKTQLQQHG